MNLRTIKNDRLISETKSLVSKERKISAEIIRHLREIYRRRLYLKMGYSSLHQFCIEALLYSEGAAHRRISAMRLLDDIPEVESELERGSVSLTTASTLQNFFQAEKRINKKYYASDQKKRLFEEIKYKSRRESEKILTSISPRAVSKQEERIVSPNETEISFVADEKLLAKINKLKNLLSNRIENASYSELIDKMADIALNQLDPSKQEKREKTKTSPERSAKQKTNKPNRHIPASIRREIWKRDQGKCSYKDSKSGKQCCSRYRLEVDHIKPLACGGATALGNLRLLCANHNRYMAIEKLGRAKMAEYLPKLL